MFGLVVRSRALVVELLRDKELKCLACMTNDNTKMLKNYLITNC